jgi:hypothetical protein
MTTNCDRTVLPVDIATMRASALLILGPDDAPDVLPPPAAEVETLTSLLRGHLELLVPEVEAATGRLANDSIPRCCALACVGEARGKLRATPGPGHDGATAYARRLARVLTALCDHYEKLPQHGGPRGH